MRISGHVPQSATKRRQSTVEVKLDLPSLLKGVDLAGQGTRSETKSVKFDNGIVR